MLLSPALSQSIADETTRREILFRLTECLVYRDRLAEVETEREAERQQIEREQQLLNREIELLQKELALDQERLELAQEQNRMLTEQRDFYKMAYEQLGKRPGRKWWCLWLCR